MIYGIGVDIIDISRFDKLISNTELMNKIFTKSELEFIGNSQQRAADNFASKEAVVKSIGRGFVGISPKEIEIHRENSGKPYIKFDKYKKNIRFHLSISNTNEHSIAFVIAERLDDEIISDS